MPDIAHAWYRMHMSAVTNDADINDAFGKGGSHSSATHKAQSGASSRGSHSGGSGPTIKSSSNNGKPYTLH